MQRPKDEIEQKILAAAQEEFCDKGFSRASLRTIARKAGISVSNIYHYFSGKDVLFRRIVDPTLIRIDAQFRHLELGTEYQNPARWSYESHLPRMEAVADFIDSNRKILKLIIFQAHGSSLQNYTDTLIERYARLCLKYLKESGQIYPGMKTDVSEFLFHNIASFWMNVIRELLMHDILRDPMLRFLREILKFIFSGYEGLTEYDFSSMKPLK